MRRAARVDGNQSEIIDALRLCGASVQPLHTVGSGCPDLLVGYRGANFLLELKVGKGKLTQDQEKWLSGWNGDVFVVRDKLEAMRVITEDL